MRFPRTILSVPGSNPAMIEKALSSNADAVFLDLEDAVAQSEKDRARTVAIAALQQGLWGSKARTIRVNPVDSEHCYRDVIAMLEAVGDDLDTIILPKANEPAAITFIATLLDQVEKATGRREPVRLEAQIESALALTQCEKIAKSSDRLVSLVFGPGDFANSAGMPAENLGVIDRWDVGYGSHRWHYAMSRIAIAARAHGLRPIDGPYADYRNDSGLTRSCESARALGFEGKWCIHPAQLETVASIFTPSESEILQAQRIIAAYEDATSKGIGSIGFGGQMLDAASVRIAESTVQRARDIGMIE